MYLFEVEKGFNFGICDSFRYKILFHIKEALFPIGNGILLLELFFEGSCRFKLQ